MIERITHCPDPEKWRSYVLARAIPNEAGCWLWTNSLDASGYGRFRTVIDGRPRMTGAHRAAWLAFRGDIEGDLVMDHLCRVRACVNPDHLEPVTNQENAQRGLTGLVGRRGARGTYGCGLHGQLDGYLDRQPSKGYARWVCRICRRVRVNAYAARKRAAA